MISRTERQMTSQQLRAKAAQRRQDAIDSYERCQEDGFVSQKASQITANMYDLAADLADDGWQDEFDALVDADGRRLRARLIVSQYEYAGTRPLVWQIETTSGRRMYVPHTVTYDTEQDERGHTRIVNCRFGPRTKAAKMGLRLTTEMAPATIAISDSGQTGFAGLWACRPVTRRTDYGYPADAVPYDDSAR